MTQTISASDNITCYIRRSKEWAENYQFNDEHINVWNVKEISSTWNDLFNIRYVDFRRRINQVQQENFAEVPFSYIVNQYEYVSSKNYGKIIPTDDDDWFHPDIIPILKDIKEPLIYWNFVNFTKGTITVQDSTQERVQFESNNYCMSNVVDEKLLKYHTHANALYRNQSGFHIDRCLSIHNRTMASLGLLSEQLPDLRGGMIRLYEVSRSPVKIIGTIPDYFMKFVESITNIFKNELKIKRMFL